MPTGSTVTINGQTFNVPGSSSSVSVTSGLPQEPVQIQPPVAPQTGDVVNIRRDPTKSEALAAATGEEPTAPTGQDLPIIDPRLIVQDPTSGQLTLNGNPVRIGEDGTIYALQGSQVPGASPESPITPPTGAPDFGTFSFSPEAKQILEGTTNTTEAAAPQASNPLVDLLTGRVASQKAPVEEPKKEVKPDFLRLGWNILTGFLFPGKLFLRD